MMHKQRHWTRPSRGEANGGAKVTVTQVREIRTLYAVGGVSLRAIAKRYAMAHSQVGRIVRGESWRHVA